MNRRLIVVVSMVILTTVVAGITSASSGAAGRSPDPATYGMRTNGAYLSESRLRQSESEVGSSINWFVAMAGRQTPADMRGSVFGQLKQKNAVLPTVSDRMNLVMTVPLAFGRERAKTDAGRRAIRTSLLETARGNWDSDFETVAETLVNGGYPDAVIRLGHEFTGSWYPWSAQGNEDAYIAAYRRVHDVMQAISPDFRFEWNAARNTFVEFGPPAYPGDDYVDVIGLDVYYEPWKGDKGSFDDALWQRRYRSILTAHQRFAADHGKPVSYAEWANGGVDEPAFIRAMHGWFASLPKSGPGSLLYQAYFNATKAAYDLDRYPNSKRTFIELFGGAGGGHAESPASTLSSGSSNRPGPIVVNVDPNSGNPVDPESGNPAPAQNPTPAPAPGTSEAAPSIPTVTVPGSVNAVKDQPVIIDIQSTGTTHQWWKKDGPGIVNWADRTATDAEATFRRAGTYRLAVKARNGNRSTVDFVTVQVSESSGGSSGGSPQPPSTAPPAPSGTPTPTGGQPTLAIRNATAAEGSVLVFKLVLDKASSTDVTVSLATASITAKSGSDFTKRTAEVTIPAGETRAWIGVRTKTDSLDEPAEDLRMKIVEISGASAERNSAKGTIKAG